MGPNIFSPSKYKTKWGEKYEKIRDIDSILKAIEPIKIGSTRAVLEKEFVLCGQQSLATQRYQMRECPAVRMDVTFDFIDSIA